MRIFQVHLHPVSVIFFFQVFSRLQIAMHLDGKAFIRADEKIQYICWMRNRQLIIDYQASSDFYLLNISVRQISRTNDFKLRNIFMYIKWVSVLRMILASRRFQYMAVNHTFVLRQNELLFWLIFDKCSSSLVSIFYGIYTTDESTMDSSAI